MKTHFYKVLSKSITKWGDKRGIIVSFQKFTDKYCCYQGDGSTTGIIGWGKTKLEAAGNLIARKDYYELLGHDGIADIIMKPIGRV